jgi:predicted metal-dependent hydrolase
MPLGDAAQRFQRGLAGYFSSSKPEPKKEKEEVQEYIEVGGRRFNIYISEERRRSAVARFDSNSIRIKVPTRLIGRYRTETIESLKRRIVKRLEKLAVDNFAELDNENMNGEVSFKDGDILNILGKSFTVSVKEESAAHYATARITDNSVVTIRIPSYSDQKQKSERVSELVREKLSEALLPEVNLRMQAINQKHYNFSYNHVRIKRQSRLWGSTSHPQENINLNFKLFFAPEPIVEYVMAHELSHLKVHNHSRRFWEMVERAVPDHKERRKWLRQNGGKLGFSIR